MKREADTIKPLPLMVSIGCAMSGEGSLVCHLSSLPSPLSNHTTATL